MPYSKSKIDKAGIILARNDMSDEEAYCEAENILNQYRSEHLEPLMKTTLDLQKWMEASSKGYYIALRLKRKPQILRKLNRFHVRLSQLQDIAGARIILDKNTDIDDVVEYLSSKIKNSSNLKILNKYTHDYRDKGRDDSGYRALHLVLECEAHKIELQLRSKIQHCWAEKIERTSVVYGHFLKELEGDETVLRYFKQLSDIFYEIESNRKPTSNQRIALDDLYHQAKRIIHDSDNYKILDSHPDDKILRTLTEISQSSHSKKKISNWILIFNWATGNFINWIQVLSQDPAQIIQMYSQNENQFPAHDNFEVVLVGASDALTIKQTHSHYFGIESYQETLQNIDDSVKSIEIVQSLTISERKILNALYRRHYWGTKKINVATLKNHMCSGMSDFGISLEKLIKKGLLIRDNSESPISLNIEKKTEIDKLMDV